MTLKFRDKLGKVIIDPSLVAKAKAFIRPIPVSALDVVEQVTTDVWTCVHQMFDSEQKHIHRVEQRREEIRCTCNEFWIHHNTNCQHIADARTLNKILTHHEIV